VALLVSGTAVQTPGPRSGGRTLLQNGWTLSPIGTAIETGTFPMALAPLSGRRAAVLLCGFAEEGIDIVDFSTGQRQRLPMPKAWLGLVASKDGRKLYASGAADNLVRIFEEREAGWRPAGELKIASPEAQAFAAGLHLDEARERLLVCENRAGKLALFDLKSGTLLAEFPAGPDPYAVTATRDGSRAFVSNWSASSVSEIAMDLSSPRVEIPTGAHPTALLLDRAEQTLFVACAQDDLVAAIGVEDRKPRWQISVTLTTGDREGATPTSLALSPDGRRLYVANSDNNAIAVVDIESSPPRVEGFLPVGRYPTAVAVEENGDLLVADAKEAKTYANPNGPQPTNHRGSAANPSYILNLLKGDVREVSAAELAHLDRRTRQVLEDRPVRPQPLASAAFSKIRHVIYVIKENRTYDQVLGDEPRGNGDPSLVLFGERNSPNHHALAREFTLLDNFYVNAEVSADGHNWSTAAFSNDYVEKLYPQSYSNRGPDYDFEGGRDIAVPRAGYLWDSAARAGISYRSYGEFLENGETPDAPAWTHRPSLEGHFDPRYRAFDTSYPDALRIREWLSEFNEFEKNGNLPALEIVHLPNDHTAGTTPGAHTPEAMMADNDAALGALVEAVTRSRDFRDTVIFVLEDDAQNGPDHVDCHRSPAFVISAYTPRGKTDSRMYCTASVIATIERILGLPPLSQYDERAPLLAFEFSGPFDPRPYAARSETISTETRNPGNAPMARESLRLDLSHPDAGPDALVNEILYQALQHRSAPAPRVRFGVRDLEAP
jgi:YVTN family beta-propeller protein